MKTSLRLITVLACITLLSGLQGCKMNPGQNSSESVSDTVQEQLYHGFTANQILEMSDEESEINRKKKGIGLVEWETLKLELKNKQAEIRIEENKKKAQQIYDDVDKKLGVK